MTVAGGHSNMRTLAKLWSRQFAVITAEKGLEVQPPLLLLLRTAAAVIIEQQLQAGIIVPRIDGKYRILKRCQNYARKHNACGKTLAAKEERRCQCDSRGVWPLDLQRCRRGRDGSAQCCPGHYSAPVLGVVQWFII